MPRDQWMTGLWNPSPSHEHHAIEHVFVGPDDEGLAWAETSIARILNEGRTPLLTIEPMVGGKHLFLPDAGDWSTMLSEFDEERGLDEPILVRYMHEFNGDWYPWAGNPDWFVREWDRFMGGMPANVQKVWCPNILAPGTGSVMDYWPGWGMVSIVGLDGYDWDTTWNSEKRPWDTIFAPTIRSSSLFEDKPLLICETGAVGDKNQVHLLMDIYVQAPENCIGVVWFNENKAGMDWRLTEPGRMVFETQGEHGGRPNPRRNPGRHRRPARDRGRDQKRRRPAKAGAGEADGEDRAGDQGDPRGARRRDNARAEDGA